MMARIPISGSASASLRTNLSIHHIIAAALFTGDCERLEVGHTWPPPDDVFFRHSAVSASAVISAVCALEANLNELHLDAEDGNAQRLGLLHAHAATVVRLWDTVERQSLLRKYEWFLTIARAPALERGDSVYRSAADLIALRDALVHYKPEWSHTPTRNERLEKRLGGKFPLNPMAASGQFFIPYRCLGSGCARWALTSAFNFATAFSVQLKAENVWLAQTDRINAALCAPAV